MSYLAFQQRTEMNTTCAKSRHKKSVLDPDSDKNFTTEIHESIAEPLPEEKPKRSGFFGFGTPDVSETDTDPKPEQITSETPENDTEKDTENSTPPVSLSRRLAGGIFGGVKAVGSLGYTATSKVLGGSVAVVKGVGTGTAMVVGKTAGGVAAVAGGTYNTIRHPIETVKSVAGVAMCGAQNVSTGTVTIITGTAGVVGKLFRIGNLLNI